ncbi:hypothetical protein GCM10010404_33140 [Nonomuraea africana]|uniref:Uncharacterized protein n=1 Tax=Nonomuraea africana TaxID=46171 RepID=A0ABR9KQI2_9ACTN|nr:hypothetical protein [Nonomuraea africana]MBE1564291.1 hypothetical protein [Nonomuraea africana]
MLLPCLACETRFRPDEYFRACSDYDRGLDRVAWTCPSCGNRDDLRVFTGELGFGTAGHGRFDVHDRVPVPGLRRQRHEVALDITLDRRHWQVPRR